MTRLASIILFVLLALATPALACQYGTTGGGVAGLYPLNGQTISVAGTSTGFTLPTTTPDGKTVISVQMAQVTVTSSAVNYWDNGLTPTTSTTAGGQPAGNCTGCTIYFEVCGAAEITRFRMISQSGTATVVASYYGSAQ